MPWWWASSGRDLHFSSLRLDARQATLAGKVVQANAAQSETRRHGFFYKPTSRDEGLLACPSSGRVRKCAVPTANSCQATVPPQSASCATVIST